MLAHLAPALFAALSLTVFGQQLPGQQPEDRPLVSPSEVFGVGWNGEELHAVSRSYLARFDDGAVEITPAFGKRAPRTYPMRVAVHSIARGESITWSAGAIHSPAPRLVHQSVFYDHAPGIVERFDVSAAGLKQTVILEEPPAGTGDLVVTCTIESDLTCAPSEHADRLRFAATGFGGIEIGAVTGIDANGRRGSGHLAFDGKHLQIVLPHEFVATAAFPLEVDPLFGPQLNTGVSFDDHFPDIAYDEASDVYCIAFEFPASATSSAAYIMRQDAASGAMLGGTMLSNPGSNPSIASVNQADRFLVVWQDDSSGSGDIKCRAVRASDGALSSVVTIAGNPADERSPDVGGDAFAGGDLEALVVWQEVGAGIRGVEVTVPIGTGDPVVGSPVTIDATPESKTPAISKSGGFDVTNGGRYVVVWETSIGGAELIGYVGVDRDLNVLTGTLLTGSGFAIENPDVDGDGTDFLIVFQSEEGAAAGSNDIWCQPAAFCAGGTLLCGGQAEALVDAVGEDERQPAVAALGSMFVVAWAASNPGSTTEYRIGASNVVPGSCELCNAQVLTGNPSGFMSSFPALCAKRSNGADSTEAFLTWEQLEISSGNSLLRSHRYRPFNGGTVTPLPSLTTCGGGGNAGIEGPFAVGNPDLVLTLRNADPQAPAAFLLFDTSLAPLTTCGTCTLITPQVISPLFPVAAGAADASLPVPCDAALIGFAMDMQWAVVTPPTTISPCPLFPFISVSDGIRLVLSN